MACRLMAFVHQKETTKRMSTPHNSRDEYFAFATPRRNACGASTPRPFLTGDRVVDILE